MLLIDDALQLIQKLFIENNIDFITILTRLCTHPEASTHHHQLLAVKNNSDQDIATTINSIFINESPDHRFVCTLSVILGIAS